jgi:hypothetical protein
VPTLPGGSRQGPRDVCDHGLGLALKLAPGDADDGDPGLRSRASRRLSFSKRSRVLWKAKPSISTATW